MPKAVTQGEIVGFQIGATVPLDRVGYILAEVYKSKGGDISIEPFVAPSTKRQARMIDTNGVAGLLPAPKKTTGSVRATILKALYAAGKAGLSRPKILEAMLAAGHAKASQTALYALVEKKHVARAGLGHYVVGSEAPSLADLTEQAAQHASVGEAPVQGKSSKEIMLAFLSAAGPSGCNRLAIWNNLKEHGLCLNGFHNQPLVELVQEKRVVKLGRGRYAIKVDNRRKA